MRCAIAPGLRQGEVDAGIDAELDEALCGRIVARNGPQRPATARNGPDRSGAVLHITFPAALGIGPATLTGAEHG